MNTYRLYKNKRVGTLFVLAVNNESTIASDIKSIFGYKLTEGLPNEYWFELVLMEEHKTKDDFKYAHPEWFL